MKSQSNINDSGRSTPRILYSPFKFFSRKNCRRYSNPFQMDGFAKISNQNPGSFSVMNNFYLIAKHDKSKASEPSDYPCRGATIARPSILRIGCAFGLFLIGILIGGWSIPFSFKRGWWWLGGVGYAFTCLCACGTAALLKGWWGLIKK